MLSRDRQAAVMRRKKEKSQSSSKKQHRDRSAETEMFLKKNRLKEDVIETESGLQYTILNQGEGESPTEWSTVEVNQRILLVDGTVIKDTFRMAETDRFSMEEAIAGLKEGLPMMKEGARFRFFVPPDLAWGKRGAGDKIGAYATLIFDIRLERVRG
ncbi:FKBP-type peptidyl-prolyl cis-trans isomerase [Luteolibacter sp. AS25]|uniref:FKBP-type peptidyl-prolyl cis-trans isomerase n=1 Tax=Luteolibacter sp. AS25 TaxID=3135776 RepID=UPI00398AB417